MLSTKGISASAGGASKTIYPGTQSLKLNSVELKRFPFMEEEQGYFLILNLETQPIEDFEGFLIDPDDESLGRYLGRVGAVKFNKYFYKDGMIPHTTNKVYRDQEIMRAIKMLCAALGSSALEWFDGVDNQYSTIEEFIEGFNDSKVYENVFLNFTVAGREFERDSEFPGMDLFLPKLKKGNVAFESLSVTQSKLMPFDESMIERITPKAQASSTTSDGDIDMAGNQNFDLDEADISGAPEFEIP